MLKPVPANLLDKAKSLNPYARFPNTPGQGNVEASYFLRDVEQDILYYFATARAFDGNLYLLNHIVPEKEINSLPQILLNSPYIYIKWDEDGNITEWAAGQQKMGGQNGGRFYS